MPEWKYAEAVRQAIDAELAADPTTVVMGEEVGPLGGVFTTTLGLQATHGPDRVLDSTISEAALVGFAVGAAAEGLRPIVEIMFMDFVTCAMDQVVNAAAKLRYMSGGQYPLPLVLRMPADAGTHHGPQHSQHLETWFAHVPGLQVCLPSSASEAYWLLREAVRIDDPVVVVESKYLYFRSIENIDPTSPPGSSIRRARTVRTGRDLTVVSAGRMVGTCLDVAERLAAEGIDVEVIDLRWIYPLDIDAVLASVERTSKLAVVHEAVQFCGWGAEVAAQVAGAGPALLDGPIVRIGARRSPIAFAPQLEQEIVPGEERILTGLRDLARF